MHVTVQTVFASLPFAMVILLYGALLHSMAVLCQTHVPSEVYWFHLLVLTGGRQIVVGKAKDNLSVFLFSTLYAPVKGQNV